MAAAHDEDHTFGIEANCRGTIRDPHINNEHLLLCLALDVRVLLALTFSKSSWPVMGAGSLLSSGK